MAIRRRPRHRLAYFVGTPKGQLSRLEAQPVKEPWKQARDAVSVKRLKEDAETFILVQSQDRVAQERSLRRRKLKQLVARLQELQGQKHLPRDELLVKIGPAREKAGRVFALVPLEIVPQPEGTPGYGLSFGLRRDRLRRRRRREGRYLLRTHLEASDPAHLWELYLRLVEIEEAFRNLKSDLPIRPIYPWKDTRLAAPLFVAFLAYCLHVCRRGQLKKVASGLTPRAVLEKFAAIQLGDVHRPLDRGGELGLTRRTQPNPDPRLFLARLGWDLPEQAPPRITADGKLERGVGSEDFAFRSAGTAHFPIFSAMSSEGPVSSVALAR